MQNRLVPLRDPTPFTLDGARVVGEHGEPIAAALVADGTWTLARSPKFHRPRGPSCMRGACDGCLARVDGTPNVMTCMVPLRPGVAVVSQNTLGSRKLDLLRMTDWFFPEGMNHHELFAGVPGVQSAMQAFARRVAGLGLMPDEPPSGGAVKAQRRDVDVLVVGGGAAGMAVATQAAARGRSVEILDDALTLGGSARGLDRRDDDALRALLDAFEQASAGGKLRVRSRTVAGGVFGRDVLVVGHEGVAEVVEPRSLVLAPGAHDGVVPFENNDLPGVLSARAACLLGAAGVSIGSRAVVLTAGGDGRFAAAFERRLGRAGSKCMVTRVRQVVRTTGATKVRGVVVRDSDDEETLSTDALVVDAPPSPAYELCAQAGATLRHGVAGFVPVADRGRIADRVWAIGEVTGEPFSARAFVDAAREIADQLA